MNMYKILGGDGREYGPVSLESLRQWVLEGRANAQTQVKMGDDGNWQPLASIPELAAMFQAPPPTIGGANIGPGEINTADYELDIMGSIGRSWNLLSSNFGMLFGGCAIFLAIQIAINGFAQIPFIGLVISLLSLVFSGPMVGGVYIFVLRILRGQRAEIGDIFSGFRESLGQLILGYLIPALITVTAMVPGGILMGVPIVVMAKNNAANPAMVGLAVVGLFVLLIPAVYLGVCWMFTLPLIADRRLDFWTAMQTSRRQVSRHWWTILGLAVMLGLIYLAGILACCIGVFVALPLMFGTMMVAYETIFSARGAYSGPGA